METRKSVFYNVLLAISQVLFPLITFPYLARTLGPEHVGLLNFAESFARYFVLLAALGIPIYGVREIAKHSNDKKALTKIFSEIFIINMICTLVLSLFFLGSIFFVNQLAAYKSLFTWALIYFLLQIFNFEWFFSGMNQFKFIALRSLIMRFFFIFGVFLFIQSEKDYLNFMIMQVGLSIILAGLNFSNLIKLITFDKNIIRKLNLRQHYKPLAILFLTIFSISIYFSLDTILLGFLANNESVGYYSSALKLNKLIIAVLSAISAAMFPSLMNLYHNGNFEKFNSMIKDCYYVLVSLSLPLIVLFITCASEIVEILFGSTFQRAILPLQITAPLLLIVSMSSIFGFQVLSALSKDRFILFSALIGMIVSIALSFILVPAFKENGEAITILLTELSVCLAFIYFTTKHFSLKGYTKILFNQLTSLVPYFIIVFAAKQLVQILMIRMLFIGIASFVWFSIYQLMIVRDSVFYNYISSLIEQKKES